ncbi:MAG: DMT family transporter [Clostridiaceae bacterium]|nr:DMT family transporter [Clostridia bacterium]MDY3869993.1 DMT family transporter [Clostridiaceae bacterium]
MSKKMRGNLILLLTALIWGTAFVAQSAGMDHVQPFTYNGVRTLIGGLVLIPVIFLFDRLKPADQRPSPDEQKAILRNSLIGGVACGVVLCVASSFQQFGISMTTAGKAGFITALYIVIVPLLGVFIKKKIPKITWLCVGIAVVGFYLLCVKEGFSVSAGDLLVLCCAFFFSIHIMVIDYFNGKQVDGVRMSCIQFLVAGLISLVLMLVFEQPSLENLWAAKGSILYAGVLSCGVAYTLQILGQRDTEPTTATLILSLESVFAALSGWALLHETLSFKELAGCALVFAAVILAQIPLPVKAKKD